MSAPSSDNKKDDEVLKGDDQQKLFAESRAERKRDREQSRRNQINEQYDALQELLFTIDPYLKLDCLERLNIRHPLSIAHGGAVANKTNHQLLSRVELVNTAVATLTRVHQENEFHKSLVRQFLVMRGNSGISTLQQASIAPALAGALANPQAALMMGMLLQQQQQAAGIPQSPGMGAPPPSPAVAKDATEAKETDEEETTKKPAAATTTKKPAATPKKAPTPSSKNKAKPTTIGEAARANTLKVPPASNAEEENGPPTKRLKKRRGTTK